MQSSFPIIGESGRGKTNILNQLEEKKVYLFDTKSRELFSYKNRDGISYVQSDEQLEEFVREITELGETRETEFANALMDNEDLTMKEFISSQEPVYVIVDGTDEFTERINENYEDEIAGIMRKQLVWELYLFSPFMLQNFMVMTI